MSITLPDTVEAFEEVLADNRKLAAMFDKGTPKPEFAEFVKGYVAKITSRDQSIEDQVREQVEQVFADMLKDNGQAVRKLNLDPNSAPASMPTARAERYRQLYNKKAPGAKADGMFDSWGEYARATWHKAGTLRDANELLTAQSKLHEIKNSFGSLIPSDGGFLIPEGLRAELLTVALETAIMRPRSRVVPMESLRVPFPTLDSTSNASTVYGGVAAYWTEEGAALVDSSATFGRVVLDAKKLTARADVPNELYQDSVLSLEAFISTAFPEAVAWFEDIAFIRGSGVGEPLGWNRTENTAVVDVAKEGGQAAATIKWENIVKMYARLIPSSLGRAIWVANIDTFPQLATMSLTVGTGGSAIWLANGVDGAPMTILGRPVVFTEKMETLGTVGDIAFIDPMYYLIGDRQTMSMESSTHARFVNDVTVIKFVERVDGRPWLQNSIQPNKGANALSAFVRCQTR
jgi:HK97 family phage major capsid protein